MEDVFSVHKLVTGTEESEPTIGAFLDGYERVTFNVALTTPQQEQFFSALTT